MVNFVCDGDGAIDFVFFDTVFEMFVRTEPRDMRNIFFPETKPVILHDAADGKLHKIHPEFFALYRRTVEIHQ